MSEAPVEILGSILRLLPLREKLLCECVCQNWLQLLRGSHTRTSPQLASTVWGNEVRIIVCGPQRVRDKICIYAVEATETHSARTEITLNAAETSQTATERQFVRWFARAAPHIGKIAVFLLAGETPPEHLGGTVSRGGWLFPQMHVYSFAAILKRQRPCPYQSDASMQLPETCTTGSFSDVCPLPLVIIAW